MFPERSLGAVLVSPLVGGAGLRWLTWDVVVVDDMVMNLQGNGLTMPRAD